MHHLKRWLVGPVLSVVLLLTGCSYLETLHQPNDQALTAAVQSKLFADSVLKTRDIRVTTEKGVVTLSGAVQTELEKAAAESTASQVKGVNKVVNELAVSGSAAAAEAFTPAPAATSAPAPMPVERPARHATRTHRAAAEPQPVEVSAPEPAAPASRAVTEPVAAFPPRPREPEHITIPSGTAVTVRLIDGIDSSRHRPGEEFAASLDAPVVVDDRVIIRKGADARVRLVQSQSAGRMTGRSELQVELVSITAGNQAYAVQSSVIEKQGASRGKRTAETVGGGAALGGLIGAIAGHGKGAAIGAAIGAGAGTGVQAATKGQQIQIAPETKLDFTLKAPVTLTL